MRMSAISPSESSPDEVPTTLSTAELNSAHRLTVGLGAAARLCRKAFVQPSRFRGPWHQWQATQALTAMGLSVSDAVRLFLRRVVVEQAFPLEPKVPNTETLAAMEESRAMMSKRRARFASADELFADLKKHRVRLKGAMVVLSANDAPLGPEWLDHPLKAEWADHRECHIGGDFLLTYQIGASVTDAVGGPDQLASRRWRGLRLKNPSATAGRPRNPFSPGACSAAATAPRPPHP